MDKETGKREGNNQRFLIMKILGNFRFIQGFSAEFPVNIALCSTRFSQGMKIPVFY